jgi:NADPH:quinone reductase-like Zn-dependent oxidoreductase
VRALVAAPGKSGLSLGPVDEPEPGPGQALVAIRAIGVNRGELTALGSLPPGSRFGRDIAGTVLRPAADGSGPPAGSRVVGLAACDGWAERVAVDAGRLAEVPDGISWCAAAALPVAALTAFYALERAGRLLGRHVLVTGAGGGVGRAVVQLAAAAGARVTAWVGRPERGAGLAALGADHVAAYGAPHRRPVDVLLDGCGGDVLTSAHRTLAPGARVVCYGNTRFSELRLRAGWGEYCPGVSVHHLDLRAEVLRRPVGRDLAFLLQLVAERRLDPQVALTSPWTDPAPALDALRDRRLNGKAVLTL